MPIVGSGSLYLRGQEDNKSIAFEMYENVTGSNISLHELAILAEMSAPDAMSEFYGFQNQAPPETVTTSAVSSVSSGAATFNGSVTVASGGVTARGFKWMSGNQSVATLAASGTEVVKGSGIGSFSHTQSGLATATGYSYVAWAENEAGRTYAGARTYFATLNRFTYTFTQNREFGFVPGGYPTSCLTGTKSSTVDQGSTATVNFSIQSVVGACFTNCMCINTNCLSGQYSSATCYPSTGLNWGVYFQKTNMNGNASGAYTPSFLSGPNTTFFACTICTEGCYSYTQFNNNIGFKGYQNSPSNYDSGDSLTFWISKNSAEGSIATYQSGCGLSTRRLHNYEINQNGDPGYFQTSQTFNSGQIPAGQNLIAGISEQWGNRRGLGFSYRGADLGPWTTQAPGSDIRLKTNINYL